MIKNLGNQFVNLNFVLIYNKKDEKIKSNVDDFAIKIKL